MTSLFFICTLWDTTHTEVCKSAAFEPKFILSFVEVILAEATTRFI